jgi:polyisoprenoid-binding protein YceI
MARNGGVEKTMWRIDPARSSVEFEVPHAWGLVTVKGQFDSYDGTLDLRSTPAIKLTVTADSINTKNEKRDKHLRSDDFFIRSSTSRPTPPGSTTST